MTFPTLFATLNVGAVLFTLGLLLLAMGVLGVMALLEQLAARRRHEHTMHRTDSYAFTRPVAHGKARP